MMKTLTYDDLLKVWARLRGIEIPYHISPYIPKVDEDGYEVTIIFPVDDGFVLLAHPDVFPSLKDRLELKGYKLVPFDWEAYGKREVERQLSTICVNEDLWINDTCYQFRYSIRQAAARWL